MLVKLETWTAKYCTKTLFSLLMCVTVSTIDVEQVDLLSRYFSNVSEANFCVPKLLRTLCTLHFDEFLMISSAGNILTWGATVRDWIRKVGCSGGFLPSFCHFLSNTGRIGLLYDHFLPDPFQFSVRLLFYHWKQCNLICSSDVFVKWATTKQKLIEPLNQLLF